MTRETQEDFKEVFTYDNFKSNLVASKHLQERVNDLEEQIQDHQKRFHYLEQENQEMKKTFSDFQMKDKQKLM